MPRLAPHLLPNECASLAINCKLLNGDIVPLTAESEVLPRLAGGPWKSIFWLNNQYWLRWNAIVTVARSQILDDTTGRIYYTFDDGSGPPMVTNIALATAQASDVTTNTFVIATVGSTQNVPVNDYGFVVGQTVTITDGTHSLTGTVAAVDGTNDGAGWKTVSITNTATANAGATMAVGAAVVATTPATQLYPLVSFKLGVPAPLNAPSVDYDYTQLLITNFDPCTVLSTSSLSDVTTANFTIAAVGNPQTVAVNNAGQFFIGQIVTVTDGANNIQGQITAIASPNLTLKTTVIVAGVAGNTMSAPASVTVDAYTTSTTSADGSVTVDGGVGNPSPSFKLQRGATTNYQTVVYIYKDFGALDTPVSALQFDFQIDEPVGVYSAYLNAIVGANSNGQGNFFAIVPDTSVTSGLLLSGFTIAAVGLTQTISIAGSFSIGQSVAVSDGTSKIYGLITNISGSNLTVQTTSIPFGTAGGSMGTPGLIVVPVMRLASGTVTSWNELTNVFNSSVVPVVPGQFYTAKIFYFGEFSTGFLYQFNLYSGGTGGSLGTQIFKQQFTSSIGPQGTYCGWTLYNRSVNPGAPEIESAHIDNLGAQAFIAEGGSIETGYVFTYVNQLGMESAPSPISNLFITADGLNKIITFPPIPGTGETTLYGSNFLNDYAIVGRRLYRSASSANGTSELLVADETVLNLGTNTFTDTLTDAELGVALPSDGWELPPTNAKSIISLPNGMTALISNNQICISPIGIAHAFPENSEGAATYRYPTDTPGVALGNIDSTLIALTQGFPYISSGVDPTSFSMGKLEKSYGCVSGRSRAYLRQFGVIYASTTGIMSIAGAGLRNLTQAYYDQDSWDFVNPSSIVATVRDDRYIGYCLAIDGTVRGFIFDPKEEGQAWSWFDLSANLDWNQVPADGYYTDDTTGTLYMIRGSELDIFDATAGTLAPDYLEMLWQSKVFQQQASSAMNYGCVRPVSGYNPAVAPLTFTYTVDGTTVTQRTMNNRNAFTVGGFEGEDLTVQVSGKWGVKSIDLAQDVEELS